MVVRSATARCFITRSELTLPLCTIVAPVDLAEPARNALDQAIRWAASLGKGPDAPGRTGLRILHVIPRVFDAADLPPDADHVTEELQQQVETSVNSIGGAAALAVTEEVRWGESPAEEILRYPDEEKADLLVLATHGHGALKRALIGSVASSVARGASCPTLLVPPALWKEEAGTSGEL